jgi:hypothetical protein
MIGLDSSSIGDDGHTTMSEMRWRRIFVAAGHKRLRFARQSCVSRDETTCLHAIIRAECLAAGLCANQSVDMNVRILEVDIE